MITLLITLTDMMIETSRTGIGIPRPEEETEVTEMSRTGMIEEMTEMSREEETEATETLRTGMIEETTETLRTGMIEETTETLRIGMIEETTET